MDSSRVLTFNGPYTEDKYNQFFNPNVCHICKQPSEVLVTCNQCYMISFCSEEHRSIHSNLHSETCKTLAMIITDISLWVKYDSLGKWIESRKRILQQILLTLSRFASQHESEMIMFAKSCCVCFQQANIWPCKICYSVNFCYDHQIAFSQLHEKSCEDLLLLLNMNIACLNGWMEEVIRLERCKFTQFPGTEPYYDTITFINNYVPDRNCLDKPVPSIRNIPWLIDQRIYSDCASGPLTLYYALQESNLLPLASNAYKYVIHVIDINETYMLKIWHIFLHLFKDIKEMCIVFIKMPKFESNDLGFVCATCRKYKQRLFVKSVSEPYHDYVCLDSYEKPNVIIIFETECLCIETLFESVKAIIAQGCPLLLTADSESTVQEIVDKIQVETGTTRNRLHRVNNYRGYIPHRNYLTGGFYYRNAHFIMYS